MREIIEPALVPKITAGNLTDHVEFNANNFPDHIAFAKPGEAGWTSVTAKEFRQQVRAVAKGLIADGVKAGDRVAIYSRTVYDWTVVDYAIWYAGAISVPIYETSSAEQVEWIMTDAKVVATFFETNRVVTT
ncbi:MAG: AMP-binding protein, partial [Actinomycetales bacterium]|nr:AMP-binding protein [Actinomycetales bacterium]